jgi:hypothetical protein
MMRKSILAAAGSVLALVACGDGQTGSDYKGEPLMSLRGVVTSSTAALAEDLVPALVFIPFDGLDPTGPRDTYFVKSEVEGTFPSAFTMRVYEPPPEETLVTIVDGEPAFNMGQISAVSPDHPRWLRRTSTEDPLVDDAGVVIGGTQRDEVCDDSGECIVGYPAECAEGPVDPNGEWPCGATFPDGLPWEVYGYSANYSVIYFAGEVAAGSVMSRLYGHGASIAAGYHAVRLIDFTELTPEQQAAGTECSVDARMAAIEQANAMYGTHAVYPDTSEFGSLDEQIQLMKLELVALADMGCDIPAQLVEDPSSEPIDLPFTDQPQHFLW